MPVFNAQFLSPQANPLASALASAFGNIAQGAVQGYEARQQAGQRANAYKADALRAQLDEYAKQYGALGFNGDEPFGRAAQADVENLIALTEATLGGRMSDADKQSIRNRYFYAPTSGPQANAYATMLQGWKTQATAQSVASRPAADTSAKVAPSAVAAAQGQGMPSTTPPAQQALQPSYDPRVQAAMSFLPGAYRERLVMQSQKGASLGPGMGTAPSSISYALSPALQSVLQD